jgi:DNA-binding CsgD family transcriptional regulator
MSLLKLDQARKLMGLFHEADDIAQSREKRLHLISGILRIVGGAKVDYLVDAGFRPAALPRVEELITAFADGQATSTTQACQEMSRSGCRANPAYRRLTERTQANPYVVRRRGVLGDRDWYASEFFNAHLRAHKLDDQLYSLRPLGPGTVEGIGITREQGDRPFADEDQNLLELFHEQLAVRARPARGPRLTRRESDVLRCLLSGAAEKAVAAELGISAQTVHTHVKSIYAAYGVSSRAELLVRCLGGAGGPQENPGQLRQAAS